MTVRFSLFSHVENLEKRELVLTEPFFPNAENPTVCRYELQNQTLDVLKPDTTFNGLGKFHKILPVDREQALILQNPIIEYQEWHKTRVREAEIRWHYVRPNLRLGHDLTSLHLPLPTSYSPSPNREVALEAWHHPFRLEAMKTLALELLSCLAGPLTFLIHDGSGEWSFAFSQIADYFKALGQSQPPFRIVLIQVRPSDHLCSFFEGQVYQPPLPGLAHWSTYIPTPSAIRTLLLKGLLDSGGTAMSVTDDALDNPLGIPESAIETLARTGFVDEEDSVCYIDPHPRFESPDVGVSS